MLKNPYNLQDKLPDGHNKIAGTVLLQQQLFNYNYALQLMPTALCALYTNREIQFN